MASTYLVPVDFSKTSEAALKHALSHARDQGGKLFLLHVIPTSAMTVSDPQGGSPGVYVDYMKLLREDAEKEMQKLVKKHKLKKEEYRSKIIEGGDPATVAAREAKKARATMIIMGSHGRSGVQRLFLGSVAERTLRYARCPVLIVKG